MSGRDADIHELLSLSVDAEATKQEDEGLPQSEAQHHR